VDDRIGVTRSLRPRKNAIGAGETDPELLAAAITRVLSDSVLRQRLSEGAKGSAQRFALPTIAAAYDRVLGAMVE
jgi:glycosyltransferase involved in cell wall biosynthesis